tara:strand:+ start:830 stop:1255 length:426 start_codon:yes stop_codon:yes gene_type:complete
MQIYVLPYPPSINSLYRHSGPRVYKTAKWKEWIAEAGYALAQQKGERRATITQPIAIELAVGRPDKRVRDLDNLTKVVFDFLQSPDILGGKIIENDHLIHHYEVYWSDQVVGIQVMVKELGSLDVWTLNNELVAGAGANQK